MFNWANDYSPSTDGNMICINYCDCCVKTHKYSSLTRMKQMWQTCEAVPDLVTNEIHVWKLGLNKFQMEAFWDLLSDDEKDRANRFMFIEHKQKFVIAHGVLRVLLGEYLETEPNLLEFKTNDHGKPQLNGIKFNLSHSKDMALLAFSKDIELGVDIEFNKDKIDYLELAQRFFSASEYQQLQQIGDLDAQKQAFFQCWTRKEAFIKAIGEGLFFALDKFDVDVLNMDGDLLRNINSNKYAKQKWSVINLNLDAKKYTAALGFNAAVDKVSIKSYQYMPLK